MISHYIIMSSSYKRGERIAFDYCPKDEDASKLTDYIEKIMDKCGKDVSISLHSFQTENTSWRSVEKKDPYFEGVKVIRDIDKFINLILEDRTLEGYDVAKYITSQISCTHLKLEKLVYLCYAEYLCKTGKRLFSDKIYAFKLGPVVDSVYSHYKGYQKTMIKEMKQKELNSERQMEMPFRSRILFAENGIEKDRAIRETIEKYGKYTARELVDITHKPETPWSKTYDGTKYKQITDETIEKYHKNEFLVVQ